MASLYTLGQSVHSLAIQYLAWPYSTWPGHTVLGQTDTVLGQTDTVLGQTGTDGARRVQMVPDGYIRGQSGVIRGQSGLECGIGCECTAHCY